MHRLGVAAACALLAATAAAQPARFTNLSTGGMLRPGVYGRIQVGEVKPPLVHAQPVLVERPMAATRPPVYLYVPPGQVRRWARHCAKWDACDRPVYFVRVDDSPSRLGDWKKAQRPAAQSSVLHALNRFTQ